MIDTVLAATVIGALVATTVGGLIRAHTAKREAYVKQAQFEDLTEALIEATRAAARATLESKLWERRYVRVLELYVIKPGVEEKDLGEPDNPEFGTYHGGGLEL